MDPEDLIKGGKSESFIGYMTTVTTLEKNELLNVFQYVLLVIIPLVLFLKFMKEYIPPESASKSSIEITTEVVLQLLLIFVVFWLIHKVVMYVPTYTTVPYEKLNLVQLVLPVLFLLFCMKSSISEKLSILLDRSLIMVGLKVEPMTEDPKNASATQTRKMPSQIPPSLQQMPQMPMNTSHESREMPQMPMNYGISEPVASNEMGSPFVNY